MSVGRKKLEFYYPLRWSLSGTFFSLPYCCHWNKANPDDRVVEEIDPFSGLGNTNTESNTSSLNRVSWSKNAFESNW